MVVLLGASLFFLCFNGYLSLYVLRLTLALPLVSLLISLPGILGIRLELTAGPGAVRKGQALPLRLIVDNRLPVVSGRSFVTLTVYNTLTGETQEERFTFTAGRKALVISHQLTSHSCGQVVCRLSKARSCDYMGLFVLPARLGRRSECTVLFYPAIYRPALFLDQVSMPDGEGERYSQSRPGDDPSELFDLREYREGDKLSRVHWKLSQKTGNTLVKEFGLPISDHIFFLLELGGSGAETDALLDAFASLSAFLSELETAHRIGFQSRKSNGLTVLEIADTEDFRPALDALLLTGSQSPLSAVREEELPSGVSHVIYLCRRPDTAVLDSLRAGMPSARISVLLGTEEPSDWEGGLPGNVEVTVIRPGSVLEDLNGFRL